MSDNSDDHSRDNTSPKLKPKDAIDKGYAPPGQIRAQSSGPTPTAAGGVKVVHMTVDVIVQENEPDPQPELTPEEQRSEYLNNLPENTVFTSLTGNELQDNESIARGEVPVTDEELAALQEAKSPQVEENTFDQMMQSDGSTPFQTTNDPEVNRHYKDRGETPTPKSVGFDAPDADGPYNRPRGTPEDLQASFNEAAAHSNEAYKSKEQERD